MKKIDLKNETIKRYLQEFLEAGRQEMGFNRETFADKSFMETRNAGRYLAKDISNMPKLIPNETYLHLLMAIDKTHQDFVNFIETKTALQQSSPQTVNNTINGDQGQIISDVEGDININITFADAKA